MMRSAHLLALLALLSLPAGAGEPRDVSPPAHAADAVPVQSAELRLRARAAALRLVKQTARRLGFGDAVVRQIAEPTAALTPIAWQPEPREP